MMLLPSFTPSKRAIEWARAEEAAGDANKTNGFTNFSDRRWTGFLGEWYFGRWLQERGVVFRRLGGNDTNIDFIVGKLKVGIKTCGAAGSFSDQHVVNVYDRHRESSPERLFFVGHVGLETVRSVVMLGGLGRDEFFNRATFVPAGGMLNPTTVAENDVWNLPVGDLAPPRTTKSAP